MACDAVLIKTENQSTIDQENRMFTKPIIETLPIAVIAPSILLMLLLHSAPALIIGGILIVAACIMLYLD